MKKFLQAIFCHSTIEVTDATSGKKEKATYYLFFGFPAVITYKPV